MLFVVRLDFSASTYVSRGDLSEDARILIISLHTFHSSTSRALGYPAMSMGDISKGVSHKNHNLLLCVRDSLIDN